jgi:hypothetical protein
MTNVTNSASDSQKPATQAPATPQQQTQSNPQPQGSPAKPADKPSEQQK